MRRRKNYPVDDLRKMINSRLAALHGSRESRIELCVLLEAVLHATGNYKGFGYLGVSKQALEEYYTFLEQNRESLWTVEYEAESTRLHAAAFGDESRRVYY